MEVIKKNLFSIIFGVVAILAVVALSWPISGLFDGLQKEMDQRMDVAKNLSNMAKASRSQPILSPDQQTPQLLGVFPTEAVIDKGVDATNAIKIQANNMLDRAVEANQHVLLVPDELPKPNAQTRYEFAEKYQQQVDKYARWKDLLHLVGPPTPDEVTKSLDDLKNTINKSLLVLDATGNPTADSVAQAAAEYQARSQAVKPKMELESALGSRIYVVKPALQVDESITKNSVPAPDKIASAQLQLWVIDDVANAIARANNEYTDPATPGGPPQYDVLHSAVKQIEAIEDLRPVLAVGGGVDPAAGVTTAVPKSVVISPTGRVCNGLYDVLQFKVRLVVDAAKITEVLHELEYKQFITVLNVQFNGVVDPATAEEQGFRFGDKPVVRVEFDCEELLLRKWLDNLLPDSMKNGLGKGSLAPRAGPEEGEYGTSPYGNPPNYGGYPNPNYGPRGYRGRGGYPGGYPPQR